jgi:ubiquinone/menaquinone biosynthesis C-methylase UbiE
MDRPHLTPEEQYINRQMQLSERMVADGPRFQDANPMSSYVLHWRLREAMRRLDLADPTIPRDSKILILCASDGLEGTALADLDWTNITVSDLSQSAADTAVLRDPRLKALVLNAEDSGLPHNAYDIVLIQDGLHHLQRPVQGFTEMLRIASRAAIFMEPHQSLVGRLIGTEWEVNGNAVNYVFRWSKDLVQDVASSYLGRDAFQNLSFTFWHHNPVFYKIGGVLGSGTFSITCIRALKATLDALLASAGNNMCGMILKNKPAV